MLDDVGLVADLDLEKSRCRAAFSVCHRILKGCVATDVGGKDNGSILKLGDDAPLLIAD